jgi:H+/Cl- antiporter ClcA
VVCGLHSRTDEGEVSSILSRKEPNRLALGSRVMTALCAALAAPLSEAAAKRLRERQRSRRFVYGAVGTFLAYVVAAYLPAVLQAVGGGGDDGDDEDDE